MSGIFTTVSGFVSRVQDTSELSSYDEYYETLRLDYEPRKFYKDTDKSMYIIRFKTDIMDNMINPYSKHLDDNSKKIYLPPCTGNGFTAARNGKIVPEFVLMSGAIPYDGAEIYEVTKTGEEILRAEYKSKDKKFIPVKDEEGLK